MGSRAKFDSDTTLPTQVPLTRYEFRRQAQYLGSRLRKNAGKDNFFRFVNVCFPRFDECRLVATELLNAREPEMVACIKEYKKATDEKPHYRPFDYMLNRILSLASRLESHADANKTPPMPPPPAPVIKNFKARYPDAAYPARYGKLSAKSKSDDAIANEAESACDSLPKLVFVNSHNRRLSGCDAERQYVTLLLCVCDRRNPKLLLPHQARLCRYPATPWERRQLQSQYP